MIVGWIGSLRPNEKRKTARYHAAALEIRIIGFRRVCRSPQKSSNGGYDAEFARDSWLNHVPVNRLKPPIPPRAIPGHLTRVKLRTVGNLTQNEARPVGHLTFVSKRLSAVGNKRISQFFDSARAPRSRVMLLSIPRGFFCCCRFYIVEYAFV